MVVSEINLKIQFLPAISSFSSSVPMVYSKVTGTSVPVKHGHSLCHVCCEMRLHLTFFEAYVLTQ